jgi:hypothetical protein
MLYLRVEAARAALGNVKLDRVIVLSVAGEILGILEYHASLVK